MTDLIEKCIVVLFWCPSLIGFLGGHLLAQYWNSGFVDITMVMLFLEVYLGNYHNMSFFSWIDWYGSCVFLNISNLFVALARACLLVGIVGGLIYIDC